MAKINPSSSNESKTPGVKLFPTGEAIVVVNWAEQTTSGSGNPRVTFRLKGITPAAVKDLYINEDCYLESKSVWKLNEFAKAVGVTQEFDTEDTKQMVELFVGRELKIRVAKDNFTGKDGKPREGRKITSYSSLRPKNKEKAEASGADKATEAKA